MTAEEHYKALENMYLSAPINEFYKPSIRITAGEATVGIELDRRFHHAAGAVHGSVYFKLLDDSAFFAANSLERELFVLTTSFTTYLTRPVAEGSLKAVGKVVNRNNTQYIVESVVYNADDREIGRGNGIFVRGKWRLDEVPGYRI